MKTILATLLLTSSTLCLAVDYGYLKKEDQKYYQNESFSGNNQLERIDSTVKEINKMYGEMNAMKAEIAQLKAEVEQLKAKK